jgi:hypothetical protein
MKPLINVNWLLAGLLLVLLSAPTSFARLEDPGGGAYDPNPIGKKEFPNYPTPPGDTTAPDKVRVRAPAAPDSPPRNIPGSAIRVKAPPAPDPPKMQGGSKNQALQPPQAPHPGVVTAPSPSAPKAAPPPPTPVKVKEPPRRPGT